MSERAMKIVRKYSVLRGDKSDKRRKRLYKALNCNQRGPKLIEMRRELQKDKEKRAKRT